MAEKNLPAIGNQSFENTIKRAITFCEQSGNKSGYHFAGAGKMIELGIGSEREIED